MQGKAKDINQTSAASLRIKHYSATCDSSIRERGRNLYRLMIKTTNNPKKCGNLGQRRAT
jgi:hypothetical protein